MEKASSLVLFGAAGPSPKPEAGALPRGGGGGRGAVVSWERGWGAPGGFVRAARVVCWRGRG